MARLRFQVFPVRTASTTLTTARVTSARTVEPASTGSTHTTVSANRNSQVRPATFPPNNRLSRFKLGISVSFLKVWEVQP